MAVLDRRKAAEVKTSTAFFSMLSADEGKTGNSQVGHDEMPDADKLFK